MREGPGWKALQVSLWIFAGCALLALLLGCHPHAAQIEEPRKPIVIDGKIACQITPEAQVFCTVRLEEQVDD